MAKKRRNGSIHRKKDGQALRVKYIFIFSVLLIFCVYIFAIVFNHFTAGANNSVPVISGDIKEAVTQDYIEPNEYSRPQKKLKKVKGVVVHYTANPGSDAKANRDYFNNLKYENASRKKPVYASSHFVIGLKGQIIQCIPLDEIAYASNERNKDTISIECCHPDDTGKFNKATYNSLVRLTAWLCSEYNLEKEDIIRHYDVTGKDCPRYYVKHEKKWAKFKDDVFKYMENNKEAQDSNF